MQYFVPSWYRQDGWSENERLWYRSKDVTEFDDTVKQVQLFFRRHVAPFQIVLLGYAPNFRHFLHRQGVYHAPWWSCFDAIQAVRSRAMRPFSFRDLAWPKGVEFLYTPFAVVAMLAGEKYAQVEFAEDGNMFRVDLFRDDALVARNLYDDRGFVSCQVDYQDGVPVRRRLFDEDGTWRLAESLSDGHVVVNPKVAWYLHDGVEGTRRVPYRRERYESVDDVIEEVLEDYLADAAPDDVFTVAMHPRHSAVLSRALRGRTTVLSFFDRRMGDGLTEAGRALLASCSCVVADKEATASRVRAQAGAIAAPIRVISPYETRVEVGDSLHLRVQNVLVAVDALDDVLFDAVAVCLAEYVAEKNGLARVCLFTRSSRYDVAADLLSRVRATLGRAGLDPAMAEPSEGRSENELPEGEDGTHPPCVFSVRQCVDELHVSRTMREQRVVVDLSPRPDQFLQISAMSMGVPQVTAHSTEYVVDGRNGRVLHDVRELADAVDFYLGSMEHFNEAQIASYEIGGKFSAQELVRAWKEVIGIGGHQGAPARD